MTLRPFETNACGFSPNDPGAYQAYFDLQARAGFWTGQGLVRGRRRLISAGQLGANSAEGIFNPGSLKIDGHRYLLCRGESSDITWKGAFLQSRAAAFWCSLENDLSLGGYRELAYHNTTGLRPEDWRLFRHDGRILSNHSVYSMRSGRPFCRSAISEINLDAGRIDLLHVLEPPFSAQLEEKNWSMFSHRGRLLCIYSVDPFIILEIDLKRGSTRTTLNGGNLDFIWHPKAGAYISNSTNPVIWDDDHYVTFIHDFLPTGVPGGRDRIYMQYAMLIDRHTLLPVSVIPDPLVIGGSEGGRHPGVHYTMSLATEGGSLYAFFGEGDSHTGLMMFDRGVLDRAFRRHPAGRM